ncbi:hypothetical protein VOLCADRAFT_80671 [Volvox carteri f. nagariensis]|uniref:GB1/RHD3-type G domain-containing protein n=1 Tax=Volvox carteri f. nagariensis TaxID=3068 RepID=D8TSU6_VOLCA|nr:uncharacterized protein VOLCADRAFT_80671 [Volvox carteri f. nagariensis]EFJ49543.1 hypothetical protein VOLCADRAFT_80671 [Volvox carteri f. nagariensis]|eukprot:XP_002949524.1 hypothetical protein VOLCADRAFT_80671 [Volvox carteri f. nagariensis]
MGGIDEAALDRLALVTELTRRIRVRASLEDISALSEFTPSFLWLLRDFYYDLEYKGVKQAPRDYLETALMPTPGKGPAVELKNMIRESIKSLFPDRDCVTLVRPVTDEEALRNLATLPREHLRPEFVEVGSSTGWEGERLGRWCLS